MMERSLIEEIKRKCPSNSSIVLGIDDDAAVIRATKHDGLVCSDMLMEGVHFLLERASASQIGHKCLAVNLSDIAAMGGRALSAYVSLALPSRLNEVFVSEFYDGMIALATRFDVAIAGGDTNIWDGPLVVNVTVFGEVHERGAVLRSGAHAGDRLFVSGPLGGSIDGHHLSFLPRLELAKELLDRFTLTSLMDVSDGLGKDLREIARLSGVGFRLEKKAIPLRGNIRKDVDSLRRAFCDGEDFELCFTVGAQDAVEVKKVFPGVFEIGEAIVGEGLFWEDGHEIDWRGYEHRG